MVDAVQHLNPYRETALDYRNAGWRGALPIPHKEKNPPPTGFTGHKAGYPDKEQIEKWRGSSKRQNICVRLAGVDKEHEIIGIDVDHYQSGNKHKKGGTQLQELEIRFGKLPDTWISSSRTDGFSGIRYFRVPRGLAYRGQVDKDIECISKGYRFAVVWPSIHPSGETYWWFPPGVVPNGEGRKLWSGELPLATNLPLLPDAWLEYLTQNKMMSDVDVRIDMDIGKEEIYEWAYGLFHGDPESDHVCRLYRDKIDKQIADIKNEATSHDKIVKAHYNLLRLAAEGHTGWTQAIHEVESAWVADVIARDKRGVDELNSEVWRSRTNALRKIKAQIDERIKIGAAPVDACCENVGNVCEISGELSGDQPPPIDNLGDIPRGAIKPVGDYRMNDDGNADHLVDMFSTLKDGASFRFADGYGWIVWHNCENPYWELDRDGIEIMRQMWQRVRDRQEEYVDILKIDYTTKLDLYDKQTPGTSKSDVELAKKKYYEWKAFAEKSGNNYTANNALRAAQSIAGVRISINDLDSNGLLLGVENGVLELSNDDVRLRKAEQRDYITMNTHIPYDKSSALAQTQWDKYLDTFLPDPEHRRNVQIILGHTLLGGNPEKRIIILKGPSETGKSTMLSAIQSALGDYAAPINETMFQQGHFNEVLSNAINRRVTVCSEFDGTTKLSGSLVKRLTGGDTQIIPIKNSNAVKEGEVQFVTIIATNITPDITPADKALENRLLIIPFETVPQHIDRSLTNVVLQVCSLAVFNWLVDGYKQYRVVGQLPTSKLIQDKTQDFMSELDHVAMFINEAIVKHDKFGKNIDWKLEPDWCIKKDKIHHHYDSWCDINKISDRERLTTHGLTKRLRSLGVADHGNAKISVNGVSARWWFGMKLRKLRPGGNVFPLRLETEEKEE